MRRQFAPPAGGRHRSLSDALAAGRQWSRTGGSLANNGRPAKRREGPVDRRLEFHRRANRARGENCAGDFASSSNKTSAITSTTCRAVARTARRTATIANLDYFFAYPEDYAQASVEWVGKEFKRRPHHP